MSLPNDLKDYKDLGAFQFLSGDACVLILCSLIFGAIVFKDFL